MQDHYILYNKDGWYWCKNQCRFINYKGWDKDKNYNATLYVRKQRHAALSQALHHREKRYSLLHLHIKGQLEYADTFPGVCRTSVYLRKGDRGYFADVFPKFIPDVLAELGWYFEVSISTYKQVRERNGSY